PRIALLFGIETGEEVELTQRQTQILWGIRLVLFAVAAVVGWFIYKPLNEVLAIFFKAFNHAFDAITRGYGAIVRTLLRLSAIVLIVYVGLLGLTYYGFMHVPTGFIPQQDKGYLVVNIQLPDSASLERTAKVASKAEQIALATPGVGHTVSIP